MKFAEIKSSIKNLGSFKNLTEIKKAGLRICRNSGTGDYWLIEKDLLRPVVKSPKDCRAIMIDSQKLKYNIFWCNQPANVLKDSFALKYILWGEKQGFNKRPSCSGRNFWWNLGERKPAPINCNYLVNDNMRFYTGEILVSDNFQEIHPPEAVNVATLALVLNSTLTWLFVNMSGRSNFGGGLLKIQTYEVAGILVLALPFLENLLSKSEISRLLSQIGRRKISSINEEIGISFERVIRDQEPNPLPDRKALDDVIFDILELTQDERREVYWSVCELVKNRLDKAGSV